MLILLMWHDVADPSLGFPAVYMLWLDTANPGDYRLITSLAGINPLTVYHSQINTDEYWEGPGNGSVAVKEMS